MLERWPPLTGVQKEYRVLQDYAYAARYQPGFRVRRRQLGRMLANLASIERVIRAELIDAEP
jgi:hypothetical protein